MAVLAICQAFVARLLFFVHSCVAIWRCADVLKDDKIWLIALANVALIVETFITCCKRKGQEWKWFSPAIFIFLLASVPPIWLLELHRLNQYTASMGEAANLTSMAETLSDIQGITIPIKLSPSLWVTVIEQMLLLFLIIGRWIMPKGEISRDALSQLLFVYIGMSSDIMELFVLFEEEQVLGDVYLSYAILAVWNLSLLQFCLVLTATKNPKKGRVTLKRPDSGMKSKDCCTKFCSTEAWSILVSIFMQDGPFLVIRMFVMLKFYLITYNTIFFTCKNILVVMLLVYRMFVVCTRGSYNSDEDSEKVEVKQTEESNNSSKVNTVGVQRNPSPETIIPLGDKVGLVGRRLPSQKPMYTDPL